MAVICSLAVITNTQQHITMNPTPIVDNIRLFFTIQQFNLIQGESPYKTIYPLESQATRNVANFEIRILLPHINCTCLVEQP